MSSQIVSKAATDGFHDADAYEAYRPSYPEESVSSLLEDLDISGKRAARIVELASGTGKFTDLLVARNEDYQILAVEPLKSMRQVLQRKNHDKVQLVEGVAARIPVEDGWGDACIAAQAFHWFANEDALSEIHRVLKPGASFGMIWNIETYNKPTAWESPTVWEQQLNSLIHTLKPDGQPRFREDLWRAIFSRQRGGKEDVFSTPIRERTVPWTVWLSEDALWSRLSTLSQIAILQGEEREHFEHRYREIVRMEDVEKNSQGAVAIHGVTFHAWTKRLD